MEVYEPHNEAPHNFEQHTAHNGFASVYIILLQTNKCNTARSGRYFSPVVTPSVAWGIVNIATDVVAVPIVVAVAPRGGDVLAASGAAAGRGACDGGGGGPVGRGGFHEGL